MTPQSAKTKGRNLQKWIAQQLADVGHFWGLEEGDFLSRSMGANGEDIIFSPAARKIYGDIRIEAKAVEKLAVSSTYFKHAAVYPDALSLLIHKLSRKPVLVTLSMKDFLRLLSDAADWRHSVVPSTNETGERQ